MNKELERILQQLHSEYKFDPVVTDAHRQWWFENAHRYLVGYLKQYARFEPEVVQEYGL